MLIACDLDRTLLPNGDEPDDGALPFFYTALKDSGHLLAYVTGRNLGLVQDAQSEYGLQTPDYLLGDVGTTLYVKDDNGELIQDTEWISYLKKECAPWDATLIRESIPLSDSLTLQEEWRQNQFKVSYYVSLENNNERGALMARMKEILSSHAIDGKVVYSEDPLTNTGLIDILPRVATKETALEYLVHQIGLKDSEVVYCGDSGNDLLPLTCGYKAVVVHNASAEVKEEVQSLAVARGTRDCVYIAKGMHGHNGNYASGVLEGLVYHDAIPEKALQIKK